MDHEWLATLRVAPPGRDGRFARISGASEGERDVSEWKYLPACDDSGDLPLFVLGGDA